ncbi:hypothetical protein EDC01DRAFT_630776 [Geopyxis carbonaria]|nr:hypothetical protein EDC01DRAFT_630776 [Geopyxis carbonaria]
MDNPEIEVTTNAFDELDLGTTQSSVPPVTAAITTKLETKEANTDAKLEDRNEGNKNQDVAQRYIAPYKLNAAKRRRHTVPEIALKRVRRDNDGESSATTPVLNRRLTSNEHRQKASPQHAIWPGGQRPLDLLVARGFREKANTKSHQNTQGQTDKPDSMDFFAPMEHEELLQANAALRLEQAEIMARNATLLAQQSEIQSKLRDLNQAVATAEGRMKELQGESQEGDKKQAASQEQLL